MQVVKELDRGHAALPRRQIGPKASADLMIDILNQSAEAAFRCTVQVMTKKTSHHPSIGSERWHAGEGGPVAGQTILWMFCLRPVSLRYEREGACGNDD